jgi:hypothetical protein
MRTQLHHDDDGNTRFKCYGGRRTVLVTSPADQNNKKDAASSLGGRVSRSDEDQLQDQGHGGFLQVHRSGADAYPRDSNACRDV